MESPPADDRDAPSKELREANAGDAQVLGNSPDGPARPFHLVDLFHLSHLQQSVSAATKTS